MKLRAALLTALAGPGLAVVPVGSAQGAWGASCPSGSGVTVVVDFASLGGGDQTRCAQGDPSTGLAALRAAGFTPTRASQQPGYFVCRIDGKPASDSCQRISAANAYWSYWHAKPGGSWSYGDRGAADYHPPAGTIEGWAFGAGKPPASEPPHAAAVNATPRPAGPTADPRWRVTAAPASATRAGPPAATGGSPVQRDAATLSRTEEAPLPAPESKGSVPDLTSAPVAVAGRPRGDTPLAGPLLAVFVVVALLVASAAARRRRSSGS